MWFIHFKFRRFSAVSETGDGDGISWKGGGRGEELKNRPRTFYNVRLEICFAHVSRFDSAEHGQETSNSPGETL